VWFGYVCMCVSVCVYASTFWRVHMCVCMYVCMLLRRCGTLVDITACWLYVYASTCVCVYICICVCVYAYMYVCVCMHTFMYLVAEERHFLNITAYSLKLSAYVCAFVRRYLHACV